MTTSVVQPKNQSAFVRSGTGVDATSASDVARQAGLDWTVSLHDLSANYTIPGNETPNMLPVKDKQAVVKTTAMGIATPIGVVGSRYQVFQNGEVFSALDSIIDSGQARYSAAGEYDDGAKVWMLLQLPDTMEIKGDPHAAFILAKTSHDGSSSVVIRPVIERLWCANQINKIYRGKNKLTYTLRHTSNAQLIPKEIANIMQLTHTNMEMYSELSITLMEREVSRGFAVDYFKKVFPLPTAIEFAPIELLSKGEKSLRTRALAARSIAFNIYNESPTQENIRGNQFGLWQSVIEYADHHRQGNSLKRAISSIEGRSDGLKTKALDALITV
jgi:phage/plasmid-like protein (TIGR03299 family)